MPAAYPDRFSRAIAVAGGTACCRLALQTETPAEVVRKGWNGLGACCCVLVLYAVMEGRLLVRALVGLPGREPEKKAVGGESMAAPLLVTVERPCLPVLVVYKV